MTDRFGEIVESYEAAFRTHGDSPAALLGPKGRQEQRFQALLPVLRGVPAASLLDYGCGLGHLLGYLRQAGWTGAYRGVDIVAPFIDRARLIGDADARFDHIRPDEIVTGEYDVVFASGVFNLRTHDDEAQSRTYAFGRIQQLFGLAARALVCDFMTTYVDFQQPGAQHWNPAQLMDFSVANLTRRFLVRHDLLPYEFTVVLFREADVVRPQNVYGTPACL